MVGLAEDIYRCIVARLSVIAQSMRSDVLLVSKTSQSQDLGQVSYLHDYQTNGEGGLAVNAAARDEDMYRGYQQDTWRHNGVEDILGYICLTQFHSENDQ